MKLVTTLLLAAVAAWSGTVASVAKLGDPAKPLTIGAWVKGKPVDVTDGKGVYVIEFWASWCPSCRTSIPHLNRLQKRFKRKGVVVVAVTDEPANDTAPFVKKMGKGMQYVVACDNERKSNAAYMEAFGRNGIPTAFIVGRTGKVLWCGHPMEGLDRTVQEVVDGKYDLRTALRRNALLTGIEDYYNLAQAGDPRAAARGRAILSQAGGDIDSLCQLAFACSARLSRPNRDFGLAHAALDQAETVTKAPDARVMAYRGIALFESGRKEEGIDMERKAARTSRFDSERQMYERYAKIMELQSQLGTRFTLPPSNSLRTPREP